MSRYVVRVWPQGHYLPLNVSADSHEAAVAEAVACGIIGSGESTSMPSIVGHIPQKRFVFWVSKAEDEGTGDK